MANNYFASGSADYTVGFERPVGYLNVFVSASTTFSISVDGSNYMTLPSGFHTFPVGLLYTVYVQANGAWQIIGVAA